MPCWQARRIRRRWVFPKEQRRRQTIDARVVTLLSPLETLNSLATVAERQEALDDLMEQERRQLFSATSPSGDLHPLDAARPRRIAEAVLGRCRFQFPTIACDVLWRSDSVNAQAYRLGRRRCVRIYGGLARHRALGPEGLAIALVHEIGHHEAGPPFDHWSGLICSDERADRWAVQSGLPRLWGKAVTRNRLAVGVGQLTEIIAGALRSSVDAEDKAAWLVRLGKLCPQSRVNRFGLAARTALA